LQYKRLFTAPRTKSAEDKKPLRAQRKEQKNIIKNMEDRGSPECMSGKQKD